MIEEAEARATVRAHVDSDDFELEEFEQGWRVIRHFPEVMMGASTLAVERETGALWEFPSSVPPARVSRAFEEVKPRGWTLDDGRS